MGILDCASGASAWKGYYYHKEENVLSIEEVENGIYTAKVSGTADEPYSVELHISHPRKSKCNCPHADGKRIVCKHIVAAYFAVLPGEAERFYREAMEYQKEEERHWEKLQERVRQYVRKMKKDELQEALLQLLFDGPEWQYERFILDNGLEDV